MKFVVLKWKTLKRYRRGVRDYSRQMKAGAKEKKIKEMKNIKVFTKNKCRTSKKVFAFALTLA